MSAEPPPIQQICKLQLMRAQLVKFIELRDFPEVVQGCYVRVLLELRGEERQQPEPTSDFYYIASVKGAKKGPPYTGFTWDDVSTEWYIIIELPPCFKVTPNGNVVQLNSISNTQFKPNEYKNWVQMTQRTQRGFITAQQIDMRHEILKDYISKANVSLTQKRRRDDPSRDDPAKVAAREAAIAEMKKVAEQVIRGHNVILPEVASLNCENVETLSAIERDCLELLSTCRVILNERMKCRLCKQHNCTVICYPCRHQALCTQCAAREDVTACPVPTCGQRLDDKFEPYSV